VLGEEGVEILLARFSVGPLDHAEEEALLGEDPVERDPLGHGRQDLIRLHCQRVRVVEECGDAGRGTRHPVGRAVEPEVVPARPAPDLLAREHDRRGVGQAPVRVDDVACVVLELVECAPVGAVELADVAVSRLVAVPPLAAALRVERVLPAVVLPDELRENQGAVRRQPSVLSVVERSQFCLGHGPLRPCRRQTVLAVIDATPRRPA